MVCNNASTIIPTERRRKRPLTAKLQRVSSEGRAGLIAWPKPIGWTVQEKTEVRRFGTNRGLQTASGLPRQDAPGLLHTTSEQGDPEAG